MDEVQLTSEKTFQIELSSDKDNSYSLEFNSNNYIEIEANQINNIIHRSYFSKYSFEEIRETKYFLQFDSLDKILDEIKDKIYNNKIILKENDNKIILNIPLSENKEIIFELKPFIKNNNDRLNELTDLIMKIHTEMNNIKNENIYLKNEFKQLNKENIQLKKEIKDIGDKETKLVNINNQLKYDINLLIDEVNQLENDNTQLKIENIELKNQLNQLKNDNINNGNELIELKENLNVLLNKKIMINNLDSKIINDNEIYNKRLKNWINPSKKIKAELLYRASENGYNISTFHKLCDNKGPTLTLFHVNDGNLVGIYTPLSWDSPFFNYWKNDMDTFIFNLNKAQKYRKLKPEKSIYCNSSRGPWIVFLGCENSMKSITLRDNYYKINEYYDKGSEILPSDNKEKKYDLLEIEVYKIIIK